MAEKISNTNVKTERLPDDISTNESCNQAVNKLHNDIDSDLWHGLCRICAKYYDDMIPIFKDSGIQYDLAVKISMYFPFEVLQDDGWPQNCCHECASLIISWNDMIVWSEKAAYKLNNMRINYENSNVDEDATRNEHDELMYEGTGQPVGDGFCEVITNENIQEYDKADTGTETTAENIFKCVKTSEILNETTNMKQLPEFSSSAREDKEIAESDNAVCSNEGGFSLRNEDDHIVTIQSTDDRQKKDHTAKVVGLQAYKLHLPMKYISINNHQYLRTKVFGFEPDNRPDDCNDTTTQYFTCCICRELMKKEDVIKHSKSHYPLKTSDSCLICYFGFGSIDCFRSHLRKHTVYIDEEYKQTEMKIEDVDTFSRPDKESTNSEGNEICNYKIDEENDEMKNQETYICEFCGMAYNSRKIFLQHIRRRHVSPFLCKFCRKRFSNKSSLKHHRCILVVEKGPNEKVSWFNCKCKKIFLFEEQYLKHTETCEKAKYLTCQDCGREFADKAKLDFHVLLQHIKLKDLEQKTMSVWICEICGCHLSRLSAKKHYLTHLFMEKKFTCDKCEMKFIDKVALDKHAQTHSDLRPFICDICKATFKRKDHVKIHMKNKHNIGDDDKKKFQCRKCKRNFTTNSYLIRHQRLHSQGVSYECPVCRSRFPTEHSLKMHQTRTKHDTSEEKSTASMSLSTADWVNRYRCNVCNQRYGSMASLKKHTLMHVRKNKENESASTEDQSKSESKDNRNEANKEGKLSNTEKNLEPPNEVESIFQCPKCSKRYLSEFGLKLHLSRTKHAPVSLKAKKKTRLIPSATSTEKNSRFKCNVCNENFCALLNLKMHKIKCKHFSKCPNCDKRFALDFKLRNHLIKVHNSKDLNEVNEFTLAEIRPYECNVCNQKFAMNHNLVAHMQRKHSKDSDPSNPISVIYVDSELFQQNTAEGETSVVYHCTDCWTNFFTEDDFRNHTHEVKNEVTIDDTSVSKTVTIDLISKTMDVDTETTVVKSNKTVV